MTASHSPQAPGWAVVAHHRKPARTLLFVPGDRPERFAKAAATAADLVIVDLEDAVPEEDKASARNAVAAWLSADGSAALRVKGTASVHYQQDVAALAGLPGLRAVVVPMADDPAALAALHHLLGPGVQIKALIETALGVVRALELASTAGVSRLAFGTRDFAADIDSSNGDEAMLMARSSLVLASRAVGLPGPVDGVTTDLDDPAVSDADATRARALGFAGKLCIHPAQVATVNGAFSPSPSRSPGLKASSRRPPRGARCASTVIWSTHPSSSRRMPSSPNSRSEHERERPQPGRTQGGQTESGPDRADHPRAV